jgi:hypothetical protein
MQLIFLWTSRIPLINQIVKAMFQYFRVTETLDKGKFLHQIIF